MFATRVKNTFLEFEVQAAADDLDDLSDEDGLGLRRQLTDSVVERLDRSPQHFMQRGNFDLQAFFPDAELAAMHRSESLQQAEPSQPSQPSKVRTRLTNRKIDKNSQIQPPTQEVDSELDDPNPGDWSGHSSRQVSDSTPGLSMSCSSSTKAGSDGQDSSEPTEDKECSSSPDSGCLPQGADEFAGDDYAPEANLLAVRERALNGGGLSGNTTVMMQHVPLRYTQRRLVDEIRHKFAGRFDFFYLPMDPRANSNRGFAFINFVSPEDAERFYKTYHTKRLKNHQGSDEPVLVVPADIQGFEANAERFIATKVTRRARARKGNPLFLRPCRNTLYEVAEEEYDAQGQMLESHGANGMRQETRNVTGDHQPDFYERQKFQRQLMMEMQQPQQSMSRSRTLPKQGGVQLVPALMPMMQVQQPVVPTGRQPAMPPQCAGGGCFPAGQVQGVEQPGAVGVTSRPARFCSWCGASRGTDFVFCPFCGNSLPQEN
eukprot:gb/GFBE01057783.1/.p1 GENE.gb/GFBE01057783.1/~~gb/GFBE01057783.1/.p1  ORF type:complete len:488 (+),score=74.19 gb/GFBE01057783.1/:1-1464(+)